ncbi:MAG: hypothetical protein JST77_09950 [Acidobacteria bacterium]|nr:hypothetical protein [Acidobacteriota bacterium]
MNEPEPLVPPYAEPCPIMNGNFSWMDANDFTPVEFIQRQMKIKWLGCFSESDLQHDRAMLADMSFLRESKISISGSGANRNFAFYFRSNPIPISTVSARGYGLLNGLSETDASSLMIHSGDIYSRSSARAQEDLLNKAYVRDDRQVKTFTDVEVDADGKATLVFSILAYPDDLVYVNDQLFDVTVHREE